MTDQYEAVRRHCQELDREIEAIRLERVLRDGAATTGLVDRARRRTGHALMAAGRALAGPEPRPLKLFEG